MRLVGAILLISSGLAVAGYLSYLFWTGVILDPEVSLVLKIAVPAGAAGLLLLLISVVRERFNAPEREELERVKP
jgi:hypothetical protein